MTQNTVFVIGAGASKEANLPTGYELKSTISSLLDIQFDSFGTKQKSGDYTIIAALRLLANQLDGNKTHIINSYLHEAWHIRDALPQAISIDNFIDTQRDNDKIALCGKLAIVRSILKAEEKSMLYFERQRADSTINFRALEGTWYTPFFQFLTQNCSKNDLKERFKSITLIIFNYDRCIEHFIYYALQNYYKLPETEAADLVKNINIYHPYGDVGTLPWINQLGVEFGMEPRPEGLLVQSSKIKTFAEGTNPDSSEILEIHKHMGMANRLVFMGFAFHPLNMQLIAPEKHNIGNKLKIECFATAKNISDSDKEVIKKQIDDMYPGNKKTVRMSNLKCSEFFKEYGRSLAF
jgi:hypothetical protein